MRRSNQTVKKQERKRERLFKLNIHSFMDSAGGKVLKLGYLNSKGGFQQEMSDQLATNSGNSSLSDKTCTQAIRLRD